MSMRILQLGPYPPPEGGVTRNMLAIRDELLRSGHQCRIIATTRGAERRSEQDAEFPSSATEMLGLLRREKFDILHMHVGGELTAQVFALMLAATHFAGKRSVLTVHSGAFPDTPEARAATPRSIRGMIFRRFGRIIAVNDELVSVFRRFGAGSDAVRKILPFALQVPDERVAVPPEIEAFVSGHSPLLLSVGGLEPEYAPLFQIEAMRTIWAEHPSAGMLIVGSGSQAAEVEEAVAASPQSGRIMVAGNVEHAVTLHLIRRADILLRTTLFDGDAISIREALHLGTPVVATDCITRPARVHLIGIGDRDALVRIVKDLVDDPPERPATPLPDNSNIRQVLDLYSELL